MPCYGLSQQRVGVPFGIVEHAQTQAVATGSVSTTPRGPKTLSYVSLLISALFRSWFAGDRTSMSATGCY